MPEYRENEKVIIDTHTMQQYPTRIEELKPDGAILISQPTFKGLPVVFREGQAARMTYYRPNGRFLVPVEVDGFEMSDQILLYRLRVTGETEKQQGREFFRIPAERRAVIRKGEDGPFPDGVFRPDRPGGERTVTGNISLSGAMVKSKHKLEVGSKIYLRILFESGASAQPVDFYCDVRQTVQTDFINRSYDVGVRFLDSDKEAAEALARFTREEQRKMVRRRRFLEDD